MSRRLGSVKPATDLRVGQRLIIRSGDRTYKWTEKITDVHHDTYWTTVNQHNLGEQTRSFSLFDVVEILR